jgi:hypothetical protein
MKSIVNSLLDEILIDLDNENLSVKNLKIIQNKVKRIKRLLKK